MQINFIRKLTNNATYIVLALFIALLSFPFLPLHFVPGIDGPLPWVYNYFADGHFSTGQFILFPHGPLAFFLYPLNVGNNLLVYALIRIIVSMLVSLLLFKQRSNAEASDLLLPFLLSLLINALADFQILLFVLSFLAIWQYQRTGTRSFLVLAVLASVFNLYIKSYGGVVNVLLLSGVSAYYVIKLKKYLWSLKVAGLYLVVFVVVWLLLYHNLQGLYDFLRAQIELSSDNSEAAAYYQVNNWWLISASLLSIIVMPFFTRSKETRLAWLWMLLPLFGAWKHGMTRGDNPHVLGFLAVMTIAVLIVFFVARETKLVFWISGLSALSFFSLYMATTAKYNDFAPQLDLALVKPYNFYRLLDRSQVSKSINDSICLELNKTDRLPDSLIRLIGNKSVDVFPCNQSIIAMNKLNWSPRPSIHSYASYTSWLDRKNADYYDSDRAADFFIWQTDMMGGRYGSIDQRYVLNDAPQALLRFYCNYQLIYRDQKLALYRKRTMALPLVQTEIIKDLSITFGEWFPAPVPGTANEVIRVKAAIKPSFTGRLRSIFYKGISTGIEYELMNGETLIHKITPKNAADGLWLNPLLLEPERPFTGRRVKRFRILCWEEGLLKPGIGISFERLTFSQQPAFTMVD